MRQFSEQEIVRREKLNEIAKVCNPYPERYEITHSLKEASTLPDETKGVRVAGRIVFMRKMGKLSFVRLRDIEGDLQISIKIDLVGEEKYQFFKTLVDVGDFLGAEGEIFTTHTGEKTLRVSSFEFLGKALKPLPEKFHGVTDPELCYRERYLDLIMNEETRKRFLLKYEFIKEIRRYLEDKGYIEIETPVLSNKASGALAKPFIAHHNALDIDVYLRIAPETYLKRAIIGGFTKVFEFARCFRNEGIDSTHLQDFTMLEGYGAYLNYQDNMILMEDMLKTVVSKVFGTLQVKIGDKTIDFSKKWEQVTFRDVLLKYADIDILEFNDKEKLLNEIKRRKIELDTDADLNTIGFGNLVDVLYKKVARPYMIEPVFLTDIQLLYHH